MAVNKRHRQVIRHKDRLLFEAHQPIIMNENQMIILTLQLQQQQRITLHQIQKLNAQTNTDISQCKPYLVVVLEQWVVVILDFLYSGVCIFTSLVTLLSKAAALREPGLASSGLA
jgi:hypothetical protein